MGDEKNPSTGDEKDTLVEPEVGGNPTIEEGGLQDDKNKDFEPKILGLLCNWCSSVFFFVPQSAGLGSKEKNGSKRNSPKPALSAIRWWDIA